MLAFLMDKINKKKLGDEEGLDKTDAEENVFYLARDDRAEGYPFRFENFWFRSANDFIDWLRDMKLDAVYGGIKGESKTTIGPEEVRDEAQHFSCIPAPVDQLIGKLTELEYEILRHGTQLDQISDFMVENAHAETASVIVETYPLNKAKHFWDALTMWSNKTFGDEVSRGPIGPLKHLEKEAKEAYQEVDYDKRSIEIADCLFLTFDAARRHGLTLEGLLEIAFLKLDKNKKRSWPKPSSDEPVEHVR